MQIIHSGIDSLKRVLEGYGAAKVFLVCDPALDHLAIREEILSACGDPARFDGFTPNPKVEEAALGARRFRESGCDAIVAVGGGSALDVAKCVRAFSAMDPNRDYLDQPYPGGGAPLIAIPTTAGTGSESTRYVALYRDGEKQSLAHICLLPDVAILEPAALLTLPDYQRKCTMLDALCHAVESWWSVPATLESRVLSRRAVEMIMKHLDGYLQNTPEGNRGMQWAANLAGQAINLAPTTAAHAMSYRLTTLFGLPHGRAAGMCLPHVWEYMLEHIDVCRDPRGGELLMQTFEDIAAALGADGAHAGIRRIRDLMGALDFPPPPNPTEAELRAMACAVNPVRLKNAPVAIDEAAAEALYRRILQA